MAIGGFVKQVMIGTDGVANFVDRLLSFSLTLDYSVREAEGYPYIGDGTLQVVDTIGQRETYTLKTETQSFDRVVMARLFGQKLATTSSVSLPFTTSGTVPAVSTFTIALNPLTVDQVCQVSVINDSAPLQLTQLANASVGSIASGQFCVGSNVITFHSSQASASVVITTMRTFASQIGIGYEANQATPDLAFYGELVGTRFGATRPKIYIPKCQRLSGFELGIGSDTSATNEYRATLPTGYAKPYYIWFS